MISCAVTATPSRGTETSITHSIAMAWAYTRAMLSQYLSTNYEPLTKSPAHLLECLVKENTMDSGIMARLRS